MEDKRIAFLKDFKELLTKHKVELEAADNFQGYAECGELIEIETDFNWEIGDEHITGDINFGQYIDNDKIEELIEVIIKEGISKE